MSTPARHLPPQPGQHVRLRHDPKGVLGVVVETSPPPYTWALVRWADTEQTVEPVQALTKAPPLA
jgi:hypothetical protein